MWCTLTSLWVVVLLVGPNVAQQYPFENPKLPWEDRVDDLVGRLTLPEIVGQTMAIYNAHGTPAIERLGIKPYVWITECIRGQVGTNGTAFPQALGLSSTFSPELIFNISHAVSYEVRARYNADQKAGVYETFHGLSCFSPVINIMRHPLWGRNQETYGEDPYLSGQLATGYVKGLQGDNPRYVRANAGCKHFDSHGGPENIPVSRMSFDAKVSMRDWRMTFLPQFKACVDAGTYNLMCSYNSINGVPACANKQLLTDITRKEWGFTGYIVSDSGAIENMITQHKYLKTKPEAAAAAIKAGCNLELGTSVYNSTLDAVKDGNITEQEVRQNVKPLFYMRMRLGEFDPPSMNPYTKIDLSVVQSKEHRDLAVKAAMKSFVLLKNQNNLLPLQKKQFNKLAIVGPFGQNLGRLYGDYAANIVTEFAMTPYDGLKQLSDKPVFASGCNDEKCQEYNPEEIKSAVTGSQLVVVCLGLGATQESEANDRAELTLPGRQFDLLKDAAYYGSGAPVILLVFNADPVDLTWAQSSPAVGAILACFYPAQSTGQALYNVLTMTEPDAVPAGRLTATWPDNLHQVPPITNYSMDGHTYRYYKGDPLYPFGYGLSYSTFKYASLSVSPQQITAGQNVQVTVSVTNKGPYDADEVVQVYMSWTNTSVPAPKLQLVAFKRYMIANQKSMQFTFTITAEQMAVWMDDVTGFSVSPGTMLLYAGGQQPNQRTLVPSNVLTSKFVITESHRDSKTA